MMHWPNIGRGNDSGFNAGAEMTKEEFSKKLPILLDMEHTSYYPSIQANHEAFWENIYQVFKERLKSECTLNIWPEE